MEKQTQIPEKIQCLISKMRGRKIPTLLENEVSTGVNINKHSGKKDGCKYPPTTNHSPSTAVHQKTKDSTQPSTDIGQTQLSVNTKKIVWENGLPVPVCERKIEPKVYKDLMISVASLPFTEEDDPCGMFPQYYGLPYLEVAMRMLASKAATGSLEALTIVLDRTLGKPKQFTASTNLQMSYQDFLDGLVSSDENPIDTGDPIFDRQ